MPLKLVLNPDSMSLSTPDTTPVFPTPRIPMASLDSSTNIDLNRQLEDIELVARAPTQQKEPHSMELVDEPDITSIRIENPVADVNYGHTLVNPMLGHIHIATLCWTLFMEGWNDGSTGPLLPRIQRVYNVSAVCSYTEPRDVISCIPYGNL